MESSAAKCQAIIKRFISQRKNLSEWPHPTKPALLQCREPHKRSTGPSGTKRRKLYAKGDKAAPSRVGDVSELNDLQAVLTL